MNFCFLFILLFFMLLLFVLSGTPAKSLFTDFYLSASHRSPKRSEISALSLWPWSGCLATSFLAGAWTHFKCTVRNFIAWALFSRMGRLFVWLDAMVGCWGFRTRLNPSSVTLHLWFSCFYYFLSLVCCWAQGSWLCSLAWWALPKKLCYKHCSLHFGLLLMFGEKTCTLRS